MHVAIYHERAGSRHAGGIAVYVRELARALAADHEVTLVTGPDPVPDRLRDADIAVRRVAPWPTAGDGRVPLVHPQHVEKLRLFAGGLRDGTLREVGRRADVVWTHQFLDDLLVSPVVAAPTGYQYHGVRSVGTGARARERLTRSDCHLANSGSTAAEVRRKLGREVDGVVRPGVALDRFHPGAEPVETGPGDTDTADADRTLDGEEPVVLFVGRLTETKGAFDLVDALGRLDQSADDPSGRVHGCFVGRGDEAAIRERASQQGVADRITLAGAVPHAELPGYYAAADVVCVPAHYESFGMANLEAMACGTPVVATEACRADPVREAAALVPPGDPTALAGELAALLDSPERRARKADAGREVARRHAWSRRADEFAAICEALVS